MIRKSIVLLSAKWWHPRYETDIGRYQSQTARQEETQVRREAAGRLLSWPLQRWLQVCWGQCGQGGWRGSAWEGDSLRSTEAQVSLSDPGERWEVWGSRWRERLLSLLDLVKSSTLPRDGELCQAWRKAGGVAAPHVRSLHNLCENTGRPGGRTGGRATQPAHLSLVYWQDWQDTQHLSYLQPSVSMYVLPQNIDDNCFLHHLPNRWQ